MKHKAFIVFLAAVLVAPGLWAVQPQAVLQSLKGKVEVKAPGAKAWVKAVEGQVLSPATTLSTGFDSSVAVVIGKTTIQVKPLTRLSIDKLVEESGTVKTTSFLRVGNVSASVKSAEGVKQEFKVQSPYSTASVRGTEFDYDGLTLKVRDGLVAFLLGRPEREHQPQDDGQGKAEEGDRGDDFVGSPDVAGSGDNPVFVPAGREAKLILDFLDDLHKTRGSHDRDSLEQNSGRDSIPERHQDKPATKGSVSVTIEFAN